MRTAWHAARATSAATPRVQTPSPCMITVADKAGNRRMQQESEGLVTGSPKSFGNHPENTKNFQKLPKTSISYLSGLWFFVFSLSLFTRDSTEVCRITLEPRTCKAGCVDATSDTLLTQAPVMHALIFHQAENRKKAKKTEITGMKQNVLERTGIVRKTYPIPTYPLPAKPRLRVKDSSICLVIHSGK